jgi:hypothetical protein
MKTKLGSIMGRAAAVLLTASMTIAVGLVTVQAQAATNADAEITGGMPVVITELAVKTSNGTYKDATDKDVQVNIGEYIELSNVSDKAVNISDLSLRYNNVDWTPEALTRPRRMRQKMCRFRRTARSCFGTITLSPAWRASLHV